MTAPSEPSAELHNVAADILNRLWFDDCQIADLDRALEGIDALIAAARREALEDAHKIVNMAQYIHQPSHFARTPEYCTGWGDCAGRINMEIRDKLHALAAKGGE